MPKIDKNKLYEAMQEEPDPFHFYLYLVINNNGIIDSSNPFKNDKAFLERLLSHYEAEQNFEVCFALKRRLTTL